MTPLDYYLSQIKAGAITEDAHQLAALQHFQTIYTQLQQENKKRSSLLSFARKPHNVKGLYLWGGVGIGKTFLMDCFYQSLPFENKMRVHFHQFMKMIHHELKLHQGIKDPLQLIAKSIADKAMVICFDEFFVSDITDAMLLGRLFHALFDRGICLIATSNVAPDELYRRGLQRELFLPAIALIKKHTHVFHIPTETDYRLRHLKNAGVFYTPNDEASLQKMEKTFSVLADSDEINHSPIDISHRKIDIIKQANNVVWFDFNKICHVPRSQHDYLEIAEKYHTVLVSNVPVIHSNNDISLFIRMVDVFYDAHTRLVLSAAETVDKLYPAGQMVFEYKRTCSRLLEMQSEAYFTR